MTRQDPLDRFRNALACDLAKRGSPSKPNPLSANPWQAMSMLQKGVRRGRLTLALDAAATLLAIAPDRFWRRAGIIAFEDIGVADLPTVGVVTAALEGKRFRQALGGEWAVASSIVARMVAAPKNRAADDLYCVLTSWPGLESDRQRLAALSMSRLQLVLLTTDRLHLRALALQMIFGDHRADPPLRGNPALGFNLLEELGVAPSALAIAREGYRRTGELLAPLVALLTLENGLREETVDDPLPPEVMIGGLPSFALDMFTREGRAALGKLLATDAAIAAWGRETLPTAGRAEVLAQALFRVESGLLLQRRDGVTGAALRGLMDRECFGLPPDQAEGALALMRAGIPKLNALRRDVLGGKADV